MASSEAASVLLLLKQAFGLFFSEELTISIHFFNSPLPNITSEEEQGLSADIVGLPSPRISSSLSG